MNPLSSITTQSTPPVPTVLVVDDDPDYRNAVCGALRRKNLTVIEAKGGREAFQILQAQPISFLLTDLRMAEGTGIELLRKLKQEAQSIPKKPVIIVNTGLLEGGEEYLRKLGASYIWVKPIPFKELLQIVNSSPV